MSMNLYFEYKPNATVRKWNRAYPNSESDLVDFPFQTPTDLTYKVLNLKTTEERLQAIREILEGWEWTNGAIEDTLETIKEMLEDPELELTYI